MRNFKKVLATALFVIAATAFSTSAFAQGGCVYFPIPAEYQNPNATNVYRVASGANASGAPITTNNTTIATDSTLGTFITQTNGVTVPTGQGPFTICAAPGAYTLQFNTSLGGGGYFNYNIFIPPDITAMSASSAKIVDPTDGTKKIAFLASGASASTTLTLADTLAASRTVTFTDPGGAANIAYANPTTAQTITNTTLTSPVIATGLTASGSASNDFSGSTGAFKTSTGAVGMQGQVTFTAGILASGAVANDFSGSTGTFKTSTGVNTFGGEGVFPAATASLASANVPAGTAPTSAVAGDLYNDSSKKCLTFSNIAATPECFVGTLITLQPQTAITTVSTIQALNSTAITIPAGAMNVQGKHFRACGTFVFSNGATTPSLTVSLKFGSVVLAAPASAANANTNSNSPVYFCFNATTAATGASGTLEGHGFLTENTASAVAGAAGSTYLDTTTAASSAVDLTSAITVTVNLTVANGPVTTATLRQLTVELLN